MEWKSIKIIHDAKLSLLICKWKSKSLFKITGKEILRFTDSKIKVALQLECLCQVIVGSKKLSQVLEGSKVKSDETFTSQKAITLS